MPSVPSFPFLLDTIHANRISHVIQWKYINTNLFPDSVRVYKIFAKFTVNLVNFAIILHTFSSPDLNNDFVNVTDKDIDKIYFEIAKKDIKQNNEKK